VITQTIVIGASVLHHINVEAGSLESETVNYGHESHGSRTR
jgi:hypothetical protein